MKILRIDKKANYMLLSADYWEVELLGYDTVKNEVVSAHFFDAVLGEIEVLVKQQLFESLEYGIKWMNDITECRFLYEIKPYEERMNELRDSVKKQLVLSIIEGIIETIY